MAHHQTSPPDYLLELTPSISADSTISEDPLDDADAQKAGFNTGKLAMCAVVLLMWLHCAVRIYKVYDLFRLLFATRAILDSAASALKRPGEGGPIVNWVIVLLSINLATSIGLVASSAYVSAVHQCRAFGRPPTDKKTKMMLRTTGTVMFYLSLLPDALVTLGLSDLVSGLSRRVGHRVSQGSLSPEAVGRLVSSFQSCGVNVTQLAECWRPDGTGPWAIEFTQPMRTHLRRCYFPEAWLQMALILIAFLVSHLIRASSWELDHRQLLRQTAFFKMHELDRRSAGPIDGRHNEAVSVAGKKKLV